MINDNPSTELENSGPESKDQSHNLRDKLSLNTLKEYGTKAYAPLVEVVHKYQDDIIPYMSAITKGLQGGAQALSDESASAPEKMVAGWFKEASHGLKEASSKIETGNLNDIMSFIEEQAKKQPSLMFSASYVAGLFFGRIGKHIGHKEAEKKSELPKNQTFSQGDGTARTSESLH